jgi:hypothetical protein
MDVTPVRIYARPRYPAREILDRQPELLRVLPNRWQRSAIIGAALVAACGIVTARWQTTAVLAAGEPAAKVAPVFQHGDGHGSFGCDAVSPPVFLAEDEARKVIADEFRLHQYEMKSPVEFAPDGLVLKAIALPVTSVTWGERKPNTRTEDLTLDGWDAKRKIGFEYVSKADYDAWRAKGDATSLAFSYTEIYDMLGTATRLRESLVAVKPEGVVAVFYDPMIDYQDVSRNTEGEPDPTTILHGAMLLDRYTLREQVRDFVQWMKAQGMM